MARIHWWDALAAAFVTEVRRPDGSRLLVPHTAFGCTDYCLPIELPAPAPWPHADDEPQVGGPGVRRVRA